MKHFLKIMKNLIMNKYMLIYKIEISNVNFINLLYNYSPWVHKTT